MPCTDHDSVISARAGRIEAASPGRDKIVIEKLERESPRAQQAGREIVDDAPHIRAHRTGRGTGAGTADRRIGAAGAVTGVVGLGKIPDIYNRSTRGPQIQRQFRVGGGTAGARDGAVAFGIRRATPPGRGTAFIGGKMLSTAGKCAGHAVHVALLEILVAEQERHVVRDAGLRVQAVKIVRRAVDIGRSIRGRLDGGDLTGKWGISAVLCAGDPLEVVAGIRSRAGKQ